MDELDILCKRQARVLPVVREGSTLERVIKSALQVQPGADIHPDHGLKSNNFFDSADLTELIMALDGRNELEVESDWGAFWEERDDPTPREIADYYDGILAAHNPSGA